MKELDYAAVLRDFQYKPNFAFSLYKREDKWWFKVEMAVEDSRLPFKPWELKPMSQEREERYFGHDWYDRMPPRSNGIGYSPSREMTLVQGNYVIPLCFSEGDDDYFLSWVVNAVRQVEEHETDEWMRYKGKLINDPHKR